MENGVENVRVQGVMRFTNLAELDTVYKYISLQSFTPCGREPLTHKLGYKRLQGETTESWKQS